MLDIDKIKEEVDNLEREKIMELFTAVININTTIPPGENYQEVVDAIKPYFKEMGYDLEEVIVPEELVKEIPYPQRRTAAGEPCERSQERRPMHCIGIDAEDAPIVVWTRVGRQISCIKFTQELMDHKNHIVVVVVIYNLLRPEEVSLHGVRFKGQDQPLATVRRP